MALTMTHICIEINAPNGTTPSSMELLKLHWSMATMSIQLHMTDTRTMPPLKFQSKVTDDHLDGYEPTSARAGQASKHSLPSWLTGCHFISGLERSIKPGCVVCSNCTADKCKQTGSVVQSVSTALSTQLHIHYIYYILCIYYI